MIDSPGTTGSAADLLGVPVDTTPEEARSIFLQRLVRAEFVPAPAWCAGMSGLDQRARPNAFRFASEFAEQSRREALEREVDTFSNRFWDLPPIERRACWEELYQRTTEPALRRHLKHLKRGLDIDDSEFSRLEGQMHELALMIRESFPLRSLERSQLQRQWLIGQGPHEFGKQTHVRFRKSAPQLAELEPYFLEQVGAIATQPAQAASAPPTLLPKVMPAQQGNRLSYAAVYLFVFLGVALMKVVFGGSSSSSTRNQPLPIKVPETPNYTTPNYHQGTEFKPYSQPWVPPAKTDPFDTPWKGKDPFGPDPRRVPDLNPQPHEKPPVKDQPGSEKLSR